MTAVSGNESVPTEENILTILVATDSHIGYAERDPERQHDSFTTFEEILQIAHEHEVDMILFGGDLFHDNKPSRRTIHDTMSLMRKYCFGDKGCSMELISDPAVNFSHCHFKNVNYQDDNLNVAYPVFSIHGNHDDPTGEPHLSAIDILSTAGLLNHFGKAKSCDNIEMSPVLFKKGSTKLALFGLGAMRDERLHRTFFQKKVKMLRPKEDPDSWFNIFVIHQNRAKHGPKNYIPESFLDEFLDLVIWGHEHECLIEPVWSESAKSFYVSQPGSSVATSLSEGEAKQKYVGILQIHNKSFKMEKVPLKTVRPFLMDTVILSETDIKETEDEHVFAYLLEKVEDMILEAGDNHTGHDKQPIIPLIRIKVEYSGGYNIVNPHRFGQQFVGRVANSKDILLFYRRKTNYTKGRKDNADDHVTLNFSQSNSCLKMEDLINEYLNAVDSKLKLDILSERKLSKALNEFVLKDEKDAIPILVRNELMKTQKTLSRRKVSEASISLEISRVKADEENMKEFEEDVEIEKLPANPRGLNSNNNEEDGFLIDDDAIVAPILSARGKGGKGRGSVLGEKVTARRSRAKKADQSQLTMQQSFISTSRIKSPGNTPHQTNDFDDRLSTKRSLHASSRLADSNEFASEDDSDPFSAQPSKRTRR